METFGYLLLIRTTLMEYKCGAPHMLFFKIIKWCRCVSTLKIEFFAEIIESNTKT